MKVGFFALACLLKAVISIDVDCKSEYCQCEELHSPDLRVANCDFQGADEVTLGHMNSVLAIQEGGKKLKHFTLTLNNISKLTITKEFQASWRERAESLTWEMADISLVEQEPVEDDTLGFGKSLDMKLSSVNIPTLSAGMFSYVSELNIHVNNITIELITKDTFTKIEGVTELKIHGSKVDRIEANAMPEPLILRQKGSKGEVNIADLQLGTIEANAVRLQPEAEINDEKIRNFVANVKVAKAFSNAVEIKGLGIIIVSDFNIEDANSNFLTIEMEEVALTNVGINGSADVLGNVVPTRRLTITNSTLSVKHSDFDEYLEKLHRGGQVEIIVQENRVTCDCDGPKEIKLAQRTMCQTNDSELAIDEFLAVCETLPKVNVHSHNVASSAADKTHESDEDSTVITAILITLSMFIVAAIVLGVIMYYRKKRAAEIDSYKRSVMEGEIQETAEPMLTKEEHV